MYQALLFVLFCVLHFVFLFSLSSGLFLFALGIPVPVLWEIFTQIPTAAGFLWELVSYGGGGLLPG